METKQKLLEIEEKVTSILKKGSELFYKTQEQFRKKERDGSDPATIQYWQGRKDGIRALLSMFNLEFDNKRKAEFWDDYNKTSYGYKATDEEIVINSMKSTVYYLADLLWTIEEKKLSRSFHPMTLGNAKSLFFSLKSRLNEIGYPIDDDVYKPKYASGKEK